MLYDSGKSFSLDIAGALLSLMQSIVADGYLIFSEDADAKASFSFNPLFHESLLHSLSHMGQASYYVFELEIQPPPRSST